MRGIIVGIVGEVRIGVVRVDDGCTNDCLPDARSEEAEADERNKVRLYCLPRVSS